MKVRQLELFQANLPFRFSFKHAAADRAGSESIFVKLTLEDGTAGWGEALPRSYVTGETQDTAIDALRDHLAPLVLGESVEKPQDIYVLAGRLAGVSLPGEEAGAIFYGAARCALEIALLDAASRALDISFPEWLGPPVRSKAYATAIVPEVSPSKLSPLLWAIRLAGFKAVKVKVGTPRDEQTLSLVRSILGPDIPLLVDANGAWREQEAVEILRGWKKFNIGVVEQPVAAKDFGGMRGVREATGLDIMADESLRSPQDAENLIHSGACSVFNIRISKCGGLISSWRIYKLARAAGIRCQLGCQVGESSVLAAAGKWFALCAPDLAFYEGGYGRLLLRRDIAAPRVSAGLRGAVSGGRPAGKAGLGVSVDETAVKSYAKECLILP